MNKYLLRKAILVWVLFSAFNTANAAVILPSFFTDNMVLQQKSAVPFWGESDAKSVNIKTSWDKKSYTGKVVNGKWNVVLKTPIYGGPYTITINDGTIKTLKNVLIGEVWLCSGQSNMEMPLKGWGKIDHYKEEISNANYPQIRLLQAEHIESTLPLNTLKVQHGGWNVCSPETVADFSATAYFFARKIYKEKNIPIGLIHSSWGGTLIEAWTSSGALTTIHDFDTEIQAMKSEVDAAALLKKYNADMEDWEMKLRGSDQGFETGKIIWATPNFDDSSWKTMTLPSFFDSNGLGNFDGIVWFRKKVTLSENSIKKDLIISYYADDDDMIWVNGNYIGETKGYNVKRHYTIPSQFLRKGENTITIRVFDGSGNGGIYGDENFAAKSEKETISLAGDWKYNIGADSKNLPAKPYLAQGQNRPSAIYNAMIAPLTDYKIKGVIWYQGESNAERAYQYQKLFQLLINDWRDKFKDKNLPFFFVQLANYKQQKQEPGESDWAELREAQFKALKLPNTGMAVTTDIGNGEDIHPKNKQDVGGRLASIALAKVYNTKIDYSGPLYKSYSIKGNTATIDFDFNKNIKARDDALKGFSIAGSDQKFYWADAKVVKGKVEVYSQEVPNPVSVRYNWADNPIGNLTNASGLPASSFRTDIWAGITQEKK
ncbi:beta galactosidase jelly roll domain-containing protein [Flavobacterium sp. AC]|uniref:Beta galactosidase jelly roll domain-containing protein n=1 Tax=Flavobacterium azizsancarii TaxID=2961580 RepID=A0ABT4WFI9_9FLAO|nr:sialate O-acetylesterase [Flavobacterium azizsancarii]MDA6071326.1 beta galactosidase jelly roll domain-containing protein [Flavobacterium azizsancarii]